MGVNLPLLPPGKPPPPRYPQVLTSKVATEAGAVGKWVVRQWRIYIVKFWTRAPPPPGGPNSFNFMQFLGKFGKIVCWRPPPPGSWRPLLGEILDPPLYASYWNVVLCTENANCNYLKFLFCIRKSVAKYSRWIVKCWNF